MRLEVLDAWLVALRRGEFAKGRRRLVRRSGVGPDRYCCLGVLCELARRDRVPLEVVDHDTDQVGTVRSFDGERSYLPVAVQLWAGLTGRDARNPRLSDETETTLAELNDRADTFTPVIDVLERWRREAT